MIGKLKRRHCAAEEDEQIMLMRWLQLQHPKAAEFTTHAPNGGARSKREAGRFKAMGTKAGVPDILCFLPIDPYSGLAIEMKRPDAPPSAVRPSQSAWLMRLASAGWHTAVCRGFEEARLEFKRYLGG